MMHTIFLADWQHEHSFGQDQVKAGEKRMGLVIGITAVTMMGEIAAGMLYGSMALLADGLHMASHTSALAIAAAAYVYARRKAHDRSFNYGTGKVNALAGFSSAVLLALFAVFMIWESTERFFQPVDIVFNQAIGVVVIGLSVNLVCARLLHNPKQGHNHTHNHDHEHRHLESDHNLKAAYLHMVADALTSLLAIVALLAGKLWGLLWMDPLMGVVGAVMVARWSWNLVVATSHVLLDRQAPEALRNAVQNAIEEQGDNRLADLHLWAVAPDRYAATLTVVSSIPKPPDDYKALLPQDMGLVHVTVEVHRCRS
jgi:cation diffusion facilitator family transporter